MHYNDWHWRQEVAIRCSLLRRRTSLKVVRFLGKPSAFTVWSWTTQGGRSGETPTRARVKCWGTAFGNVATLVYRAREQSVCVARRPDAVSAPPNVGPGDELSYATTSFSSKGALVIRGRRNQFGGGDYHAGGSYKARRVISHQCASWLLNRRRSH